MKNHTYVYAIDLPLPRLALEAQLGAARVFCRANGLEAAEFVDREEHARELALHARPAGGALLKALAPGDLLVVASPVALGARADVLALAQSWRAAGLNLAVAGGGGGAPVETAATGWGALINTLAAGERLDRGRKSEEVRAGMARAKREGTRRTLHAAIGHKFAWSAKDRKFREVVYAEELRVIERVVGWRSEGYSWNEIAEHLHRNGVLTGNGHPWHPRRLQTAVDLWKRGRLPPIPPEGDGGGDGDN
jgi:DNA invertase Pin-like site-specific DNA recombinase